MNFILIPIKTLSRAKERLSHFLTRGEREELAYAMLSDVLAAAKGSKLAEKTVVVTDDDKAIELACSLGCSAIEEKYQRSESASVDEASRISREMGASAVLRIPGDVPLVTPKDIDYIFAKKKPAPFILAVPSMDRLGTNALLRTPPDAIRSQFGHDSFRKHAEEGSRKGVPFEVCEIENLALDIDNPADLVHLIRRYLEKGWDNSRCFTTLKELGIVDRVKSSLYGEKRKGVVA